MSGPNGGAQPPSILIEWSSMRGVWRATAIMTENLEPLDISGPSSSHGTSPSSALDELLGRRFAILADGDCAPTLVALEPPSIEPLATLADT